jgi:hypothetical protein
MKSRERIVVVVCAVLLLALLPGTISANASANSNACWGQATKAFAQMGMMGEHASEFDTPRLGLRNLARSLYEAGVLDGDTMQDLGAFVSAELGLEVSACE